MCVVEPFDAVDKPTGIDYLIKPERSVERYVLS